jgi:microcystin-dependent protein
MSSPYVGEIRCFGFNFAPYGWAWCDGQSMSIAQYSTLYAVIGTIYGGDGQSTFNLPNLQGNVPMHWGNPTTGPATGFNTVIGQTMGTTTWTLTTAQMPLHNHSITVQGFPNGQPLTYKTRTPNQNAWLSDSQPGGIWYDKGSPNLDAQFSQQTLSPYGGSQPHENMQPYLCLNFCMSLFGIFPSQN